MIRPCPDCNGSGFVFEDGSVVICQMCVDMPELSKQHLVGWLELSWVMPEQARPVDVIRGANRRGGWFKPDPQTVAWLSRRDDKVYRKPVEGHDGFWIRWPVEPLGEVTP